jgi:hypothetical protein
VAWWNADDYYLMTDDGAGAISSWPDRRGRLAVTAATTARPTWARNSFNSAYPGITCDGTTDALTTTTFTNLPTGSTAGSIFVFASLGTTGAQQNLVSYGSNVAAAGRVIRLNSSGVLQVSENAAIVAGVGAITGGIHLLWAEWSGTTQTAYQDGAQLASSPGTIASLNTGTLRTRFCSNNGTSAANFAAATFAGIAIASGNLSAADRQRFEGFYWWQDGLSGSGLPLTHLYKWAPP